MEIGGIIAYLVSLAIMAGIYAVFALAYPRRVPCMTYCFSLSLFAELAPAVAIPGQSIRREVLNLQCGHTLL